MSADIQVGDLVVVVRPPRCCGYARALGQVFRVSDITFSDGVCCVGCGHVSSETVAQREGRPSYVGYSLYTLLRIPPLAEPERETTRDEVKLYD